jgi:L-serine dehydratase
VVRIGKAARHVLNEPVKQAVITFYNSFARTYEGHGSDRAILGGLMDWPTDDDRLREAIQHAQDSGLDYRFRAIPNASDRHPNTIRVELEGPTRSVVVEGVSRGGGLISIVEIDGFRCNFSGNLHTLVITALDIEGSVAFISSVVSHDACNIATMTVNRAARNDRAKLVMEMDSPLRPLTIEYLRSMKWVQDVTYLDALEG